MIKNLDRHEKSIDGTNSNRTYVLSVFVLLMSYLAPYFIYYVVPGQIIRLLKLTSSAVILVLYFSNDKVRQYHGFRLPYFVFSLILLCTTLVNSGDLKGCIFMLLEGFTIYAGCMLVGVKNHYLMLKYFTRYYALTVIINNLFLIALQGSIFIGNDINNQWNFLGRDNYMGSIIVPALFVTLFYLEKYKKFSVVKWGILFTIYSFSIFYVYSATSIAAIAITTILMILIRKNDTARTKNITYFKLVIGMVMVFLFLTIIQTAILGTLAENLLGKSNTFTGRIVLWNQALEKIGKSPVIGYGYGDQVFQGIRFSSFGIGEYTTSHSSYLLLLLYGGIPLFAAFVWLLFSSLKHIRQMWNDHFEIRILALGIIALLIYYLTEWQMFSPLLWVILALMEMENIPDKMTQRVRKYATRIRIR